MRKKPADAYAYLNDGTRVTLYHRQKLERISQDQAEESEQLDAAIGSSEALLTSLGMTLPERLQQPLRQSVEVQPIVLERWETILAEAKAATPEQVDYRTLLTPAEIDSVLKKHALIGNESSCFRSLNRFDFALAVATGVIAGMLDIFLVGIPAHPGFLGGSRSEGGWLSNVVKEKFGNLFPENVIKDLEKAYSVPFDPSTNAYLQSNVSGLGPTTHRFQSPGHDLLLGFIFGVRDILTGEFSAISKNGQLIIQQVADPLLQGERLFIRILEALRIELGHLASDVATPLGLPAPLMPLLLFLQFGKIGDKQYTIGEVARQMYRSGYDFRHFLAGSIPVIVTEIIIRLGNFIELMNNGAVYSEMSSSKLQRQLLIAHCVATLINAGKVYVTQNPLSINWAQTLVFIQYAIPELTSLLHKEALRSQLVEEEILNGYHNINNDLSILIQNQEDRSFVV
ncbi:MAG: hypothetical protein EI684_01570 [Candidatus Viridilinea halotolerans]|uniref:Uncharacterized protein n=1 Tax=Candidatus Viridilinea halotolerans TaxID=2491704 RepID=A0A426UA47_9CHLR|nr:MAG: hypothetical protein EI684_01570 [Candidatus Viridilinea halotolerans]